MGKLSAGSSVAACNLGNVPWNNLGTSLHPYLGMVYATYKNGEIGDDFLFYQHYLGFKWGFLQLTYLGISYIWGFHLDEFDHDLTMCHH
jgi:hypothetical protein